MYTLQKIIILFQIVIHELNGCEINEPFLKGTSCVNYCSELELKEKVCKIDNDIVKTQFLNNIIWIGEENYRYINFALFSNGDMIIETTNNPGTTKRIFFGMKKDGREFFYKDNEWRYNYTMEGEGNRDEAEIFVVKINGEIGEENNGKEYLVSIAKENQFAELYDFDNNKIYKKISSSLLGSGMVSPKGCALNYTVNDDNFILFSFISINIFNLKKMKFTSINFENNNIQTVKSNFTYSIIGNQVSCTITNSNFIVCFYLYSNGYNYGTIVSFDSELNFKSSFQLLDFYGLNYTFSKFIHLKEEIVVLAYYNFTSYNNPFTTPQILKIIFRNLNNGIFEEYLINQQSFVFLDKYKFNINDILNDIIRISDNKICTTSTTDLLDILYIVLLDIIKTEKIIIRYYKINIYSQYKLKLYSDMRAQLYNDLIAFAFSFCRQDNDRTNQDLHSSAFLIFGYPNGIDDSLNITDFLLKNNDIKINNITIDLKNNFTIENNIFGYEFLNILIQNKIGCCDLNLLSSTDENKLIDIGTHLNKEEKIKIAFKNNEEYNNLNCQIKYAYIVTEPEYNELEKYWVAKTDGNDTDYFNANKGNYIGKTIYYNIILEKDLVSNCELKSCELCLKDKINCITCKYNSTLIKSDNIIYNKTCFGGEEFEIESDNSSMESIEDKTDEKYIEEN